MGFGHEKKKTYIVVLGGVTRSKAEINRKRAKRLVTPADKCEAVLGCFLATYSE